MRKRQIVLQTGIENDIIPLNGSAKGIGAFATNDEEAIET